MLLRVLLFFVLACLFLFLLNLLLSWRKRQHSLRPHDQGTQPKEMVLDPQCQSYLPKSEAIFRGGHYFCSEECLRLYLSR
ncbi:MAG: PP0621 family protein [Candidatus Binatia bacterium]